MDALKIIQDILPLPPTDQQLLYSLFQEVSIKKNSYIIEANRLSNSIYFIKDGCCRIFYHKEEKEVILDFAFPGDSLISLNSYIHNCPGYENIQSLENCVLYQINTQKLQQLFNQSIAIANWGRKLVELETLKIESRLMSKLFNSALDSYKALLYRAPQIIQHVKLGYIASYLGISQVTLSRIRAKL